jgi:hypothetical protein
MPELNNMKTWADRLGHSKLRSFTDEQGRFWLEQNPDKASKWAKLARKGHEIAWEFAGPGGAYTGRMLIDGEIYTPLEATKSSFADKERAVPTAQAFAGERSSAIVFTDQPVKRGRVTRMEAVTCTRQKKTCPSN